MQWVIAKIKWIMLISGVLTSTMVYAAIAPQAALRSMFGVALEGPLAEIVVRNWGALITVVGLLLIYGAYVRQHRPLIVTVAAGTKLIFIALVLIYGREFLGQQISFALGVDVVAVILFGVYLLGIRRAA